MNWRQLYNAPVEAILRSPLHSWLSRSVLLITVTGRRSGRHYTTPVNYVRVPESDTLLIVSQRKRIWWRNLRQGAPISILLQGRRIQAIGEAIEDQDEVVQDLRTVLRHSPSYRKHMGVSFDAAGNPTDPLKIEQLARSRVTVRISTRSNREIARPESDGVAQSAQVEEVEGAEIMGGVQSSNLLRRHPLILYSGLAYALTWAIAGPLALAAQGLFNLHLPQSIHYVAQVGPAVAAVIATALTSGRTGLHQLARRVVRWRVGRTWLFISLGSPILLFAVAAAVARIVDGTWINLLDLGTVNFLPSLGPAALLLWFVSNGLGEETGWRGFALPRLQERHHVLTATLILAVFWALWHLPAFFYVPTYREMGARGAPGFFFGIVSGAILFTWIYNSTGGSILMVACWHALFNFFTASAAGHGTVATVFSIEIMIWAVALVIVDRPTNLATRPRQTFASREAEPA